MSHPRERNAERSIKDGPFAWASKEALRVIHGQFSESCDLASANSVYLALCCLASDEQREYFTAKKALIAFRAGVSVRTVDSVLTRLETLGLVAVKRQGIAGTKMKAPSAYTLLPTGSDCASTGNDCATMRNGQIQSSISEKVEESGRILEEIQKESLSSPSAPSLKFSHGTVDSIYQQYPRKKQPSSAHRAIRKALAIVAKRGTPDPAAWLAGRVQAYAKTREGEDQQFTPYPASWLNAGSYDEDFAMPPQGQNGKSSKPKPIGSMSALIAAHQQPAS